MEGTIREGSDDPKLKLIETIRWDGSAAPLWPLHLARLTASAATLGWTPPPAGLQLPRPAMPARLRLTFDRHGQCDWQTGALPAVASRWRIGLSHSRIASTDPWLRLKSTRRALYDQARVNLPTHLDEVIFANEHDEIGEGSISNVFFDRGDGMRSTPLRSGALPGVLRHSLNFREEILHREDLPKVRLWVGNALRGLIPADFTP